MNALKETLCSATPISEFCAQETIGNKDLSISEIKQLITMNEKYIQVVVGGKHRILIRKHCVINGEKISYESIGEFKNYFVNQSNIAEMNAGTAWLKWAGKKFYPDGISFHPCQDSLPSTVYNTFSGFPCIARIGNSSPILKHIREVLCGGDDIAAEYFISWLAHLFQKPSEKPTVAILMKSVEGAGKGTLYRLLNKMLGINSYQINGDTQITGRFNSVVAGKLLIFADEVTLTDRKVFDSIKGIISEPTLSMELKGLEPELVPNFARFIFAGNHDRVLRAGTRERRFLVLEPTSCKVGDLEYWNQLNSFIRGDGAQVFLNYLLELDLDDFKPYDAPTTKGLIQEKLASLTPVQSYFYSQLSSSEPFSGFHTLYASDLNRQYQEWGMGNGFAFGVASARSQVGKLMSSLRIDAEGRSGRGKGKYYRLPDRESMKSSFADYLGHSAIDIFD
jgi:putative DNA primase/helicase